MSLKETLIFTGKSGFRPASEVLASVIMDCQRGRMHRSFCAKSDVPG
ncbi:MAG: hypothetical protein ACLVIY_04925 [Anaerobutyricum soehngenii]